MTLKELGCGTSMAIGLAVAYPAQANQEVAVAEVLRSWHGDPAVGFVELNFLADGQGDVYGSLLEFTADDGSRPQTFVFGRNVPYGDADRRVLIATEALWKLTAVQPDFRILPEYFPHGAGSVCYRALSPDGSWTTPPRGCLRWGGEGSGPDDRSLVRNGFGVEVALSPTPQNNFGGSFTLPSSCGDALLQDWEVCDGADLDGKTCGDFGFFAGDLGCKQCQYDTGACSNCGNGVIDDDEQCDGGQLDAKTCSALGYTSGTLACSAECAFDKSGCSGLQMPGRGGRRRSECALEWNITTQDAQPRSGLARCTDGKGCDQTADLPGVCGFRVQLCFNRDDDRFPCGPGQIEKFTLMSPDATQVDGSARQIAAMLLDAVAALGEGGIVTGRAVVFPTPLAPRDVCTKPVVLSVPACERRQGSRRCRGTTKLVTRTTADAYGRRDRDVIELQCMPTE